MPIALDFFLHYAYGILFLWVLVEQLGVPVPSVPLLLTAGSLTAAHKLHAVPVMASVLLACGLADSLWYFAGVRYGGRVVRLICRLSLEAGTCVKRTEGYFGRHGGVTLLFAKFVPGLSAVAPPIAGQSGMPYARFLAYDLTGSLIWSSAYVFGGRFVGDLAKRSRPVLHFVVQYGVLLFGLAVLALVLRRFWKQRAFLQELRDARITVEELHTLIDAAAADDVLPPFIVDLRHPLEFLPDGRVIPGAVHIPPAELEKNADLIPRDRDVILYCTCPNEETSASLAKRLQKIGVHRVRPLKGGYEIWRDAGYPLERYDREAKLHAMPALAEVASV